MPSRPVNVLIYAGTGSTAESVRHCLYTLRKLLSPHHAVIPISGEQVINEPWLSTCAAIVFPGGADLGYCRTLNGEGNRRIRRFVEGGGVYIGFCAGGYYGSKRCEFEVGNKALEVVGDRELAFFPGTDRGGAFNGFVYHSERGARAAELQVNKDFRSAVTLPSLFHSYYNGGGVFVDAEKYRDQGVEVLASYTEPLDVDSGHDAAAVIYCKRGRGHVLLTGPHPEFVFLGNAADNWSLTKPRFAAQNLKQEEDVPGFDKLVEFLARNEKQRMDFMRACLIKLGLSVDKEQIIPPLSRIHLSCLQPCKVQTLVAALEDNMVIEDGEHYLDDDTDRFHFVSPSTWDMERLRRALDTSKAEDTGAYQANGNTGDRIVDNSNLTKDILIHDRSHPSLEKTPYFDHEQYYTHLAQYQTSTPNTRFNFGQYLLYGEVLTSTNTLLEKNTQLLRHLPTGFTAAATSQLAGRGRGTNVWVSPPGSLMFSTIIRHPMNLMAQAPVVFVQYLAALAIIDGIKTYDGDLYRDMPVKLKWPNDIYALDPEKVSRLSLQGRLAAASKNRENFVKIGGILVNSHYNTQDYIAVCGVGLNLSNSLPTTSLNALLPLVQNSNFPPNLSIPSDPAGPQRQPQLQRLTSERLLPRILTCFDSLYTRFLTNGFDRSFQNMYYEHWLHGDQVVTLEAEGGMKARIKGITEDYGFLVAEEVVWVESTMGGAGGGDRWGGGGVTGNGGNGGDGGNGQEGGDWSGTGKVWKLQSDSNSFDFFRGLVKRKM